MILGRIIVGLGVGLASCIIPLYIGELAPTSIRGRLVTINNVAITLGQVVAYGKFCSAFRLAWETSAEGSDWSYISKCDRRLEVDGWVWCFTISDPTRNSYHST